MKQVVGDLWEYYNDGKWVCVTTCSDVMRNGMLVMGAGCAREARERFLSLPRRLGVHVQLTGNIPLVMEDIRVISFPTKRLFRDKSDMNLILQSAQRVKEIVDNLKIKELVIPRPGCGLGELNWKDVYESLKDIFSDDRFVIIRRPYDKKRD